MYICAAFTPGILWLGRSWPVEQAPRWKRVALHLGVSAIFSLLSAAIETPVLLKLGVYPGLPSTAPFGVAFWRMLVYGFHGGVLRYWAVIGLQAVVRSHRNAQQREVQASELAAQLSAAQLSALKMQLQPHFLFNTLSAIMTLVRQQKGREAESMVARLSDLLRLALDDVEAQEVPLWRELEFLRLYLSIEQVRFEDRLRVEIAADPDLSAALVPHMALQPIVENAVRHGLGQSEQPVCIRVHACRIGKDLVVTVTDDGPGSPPSGFEGKGIGLMNTRNRLQRLYGPASTLVAANAVPRGVRVTMTMPFHLEDQQCG
jgi:LytS/YehU family sensor histidine kinase